MPDNGSGPRFDIIVRCSDPRLDPFFTDAASRIDMGLPAWSPDGREAFIANVGGLLGPMLHDMRGLVRDIELLARRFGHGRAVVTLTAHSDCGAYEERLGGDPGMLRRRQLIDLEMAAGAIRSALPSCAVRTAYLDLEPALVTRTDKAVTA